MAIALAPEVTSVASAATNRLPVTAVASALRGNRDCAAHHQLRRMAELQARTGEVARDVANHCRRAEQPEDAQLLPPLASCDLATKAG